jgi:pimeloyl-ACP methyl ester carboxylesterase
MMNMSSKIAKTALKVVVGVALLLVVAVIVVPFLIPVTPLEGLVSAAEVAADTSKFVTIPFEGTGGIDIHYLTGEGSVVDEEPTFILLHGSLFNAFTWTETINFFDEYGQVLAYDQIPYGLSEKLLAGDWTDDNPYTLDAAVTQLFAFMDVMDVDTAILVGNSYGCVIALEAARQQPDRVEALIVSDAAVYVNESIPTAIINLPQVQRLGPLFARQLGQSETFIQQTYLNPDQISPERLSLTQIHTQVIGWDESLWQYLQIWGANPTDIVTALGDIQQPTLVLTGDSDAVVPIADSEQLHATLPDSELVILPQCGHVPQEECPEAFASAVSDWLMRSPEA